MLAQSASLRLALGSSVAMTAVLLMSPLEAADPGLSTLNERLERIAKAAPGEIGVSVVHVESGAELFSFNGKKPFPMASVYKLPIAFEMLAQISERRLKFDDLVAIGPTDIRDCCTLSRRHPRGGITMTLLELMQLMLTESDNTASDAVLRVVGGPQKVERRLRALGFGSINVNRYQGEISFQMMGVIDPPPEAEWTLERQTDLVKKVSPTELSAARARYTVADLRDTATPNDMSAFLVRLQRGELLPKTLTDTLLGFMAYARTGPKRLKARLPDDTIVAHKTGTTAVVVNDVGIVTLPNSGGHLAVAVFVKNGGRIAAMEAPIAQIAAVAYESFTGQPIGSPAKPTRGVAARTAPIREALGGQ